MMLNDRIRHISFDLEKKEFDTILYHFIPLPSNLFLVSILENLLDENILFASRQCKIIKILFNNECENYRIVHHINILTDTLFKTNKFIWG